MQTSTVVFGLDGAHFELIENWIDQGKLPNIEKVIDSGITGDLESVLPPVTSPNWKSYATGKNPGKFGIFWWENIDMENQRVHYPSNRKHEEPEFWEIICRNQSACVINVPTTYPPKPINGLVIAGAPDGENDGFAQPPKLEKELTEKFRYRVNKENRLKDDREKAAEEILDLIELRFEVAEYLYEQYDPDFLQVTTFYINSLHHFLWDDEYTLEGWQIIDRHLAYFLDEGVNIVLMSDHGSNEIETVFHINSWLQDENYLFLDKGMSEYMYKFGVNTDRIIRLTTKLGVRDLVEKLAPSWLINRVPDEHGEINRESKTDNVDWNRTKALASGQGPIYLNVNDEIEHEELRDEIIRKLKEVTSPEGVEIADDVLRGEDVYSGKFVEDSPDIVIDQAKGVHIPGSIGRDEIFTVPTNDGWIAENKREGLFIASGPDFNEGEIDNISILDLAPTILHLMDCEVPMGMDGEVRKSVFANDSNARKRDVEYSKIDRRIKEINNIRSIVDRSDF